jgi:hypothetical protein
MTSPSPCAGFPTREQGRGAVLSAALRPNPFVELERGFPQRALQDLIRRRADSLHSPVTRDLCVRPIVSRLKVHVASHLCGRMPRLRGN